MAKILWIRIMALWFAVAASKPTTRNTEFDYCYIACMENEICHVQYIVKATITGQQVLHL